MRFLLRLVINALALVVAAAIVPGIHLEGGEAIFFAALIFGVINAIIRPLVTLATCLLHLITLGLFTLVVNAGMLWLTSWVAQNLGLGFQVDGFLPAFLGAIVISVVSFILTRVVK